MKFLCLIYMNEKERDAIPAEQWEPLMQEGFDVGLEMSGNPAAFRDMLANMAHGGKIAMLGIPYFSEIRSDCVPLPAPWGPKITRRTAISRILRSDASSAATRSASWSRASHRP